MSLSEKQVIATYNMYSHAYGLSQFIHNQIGEKPPIVYVMDEEGNHVKQARFEEITLADGSKVWNLVLKMDN